MGWVGFYEENLSLYTFLGDHSYSLKFPGDREAFLKFAKKLGLSEHKISETEFRDRDLRGQWSRGVTFDEKDKLHGIRFYSESQ